MRSAALLTLVAFTGIAVGCGSDGEDQRVGSSRPASPPATSPAGTSTSTTAPAEGRIEGVVVDMGQNFDVDLRFWWLVDLLGGRSVDGATRLMIDVADELGCGAEHHPISSFQISVGDTVSFELTGQNPGAPPEMFMRGSDVSAARPVAARQFRIDCPADIDDVAATIADQRTRWEAAGIASYQFSMSWMQFNDLAGDYRITVVDGTPQDVVRGDGVVLDPQRLMGRLPMTVDEVFDELDRNVTADSFTATYDAQHGYPTAVKIDQVAEGVDDELEISITDFTVGAGAPAASAPATAIGDRIEARPLDWHFERPADSWHWLLVDAIDGSVIDGSSRLVVGVAPGEVVCGPELRPVDSLESLEGGDVSFELVALGAPGAPVDTPMWQAGVPVTGRQLHIPTCPQTIDDILAAHADARARWRAAGIMSYEFTLNWSPARPAPTTFFRVTVVDGQTTAVVPAQIGGEPPPPSVEQSVLDAVPGTIDEVFQRLETEILAEGVHASYHQELGYPDWVAIAEQEISISEFDRMPG